MYASTFPVLRIKTWKGITYKRIDRFRTSVMIFEIGTNCYLFCYIFLTEYGWVHYNSTSSNHILYPTHQAERERINSLGGAVMMFGGLYRVNGSLAVSRAIGECSYRNVC